MLSGLELIADGIGPYAVFFQDDVERLRLSLPRIDIENEIVWIVNANDPFQADALSLSKRRLASRQILAMDEDL